MPGGINNYGPLRRDGRIDNSNTRECGMVAAARNSKSVPLVLQYCMFACGKTEIGPELDCLLSLL